MGQILSKGAGRGLRERGGQGDTDERNDATDWR